MIDKRTLFEIHRLAHEGLSMRQIARALGLHRETVSKYLHDPHPKRVPITRSSKLDPFKDEIERLLEIDSTVSAVVLRQRLADQGFDGGIGIVRTYLQGHRAAAKKRRPVIRFESDPGVQCQIDWGHFGSIAYGATRANSIVSAGSNVIAACSMSNSPIPNDKTPCTAACSMPFAFFRAPPKNSCMTI
jgi:transposase